MTFSCRYSYCEQINFREVNLLQLQAQVKEERSYTEDKTEGKQWAKMLNI